MILLTELQDLLVVGVRQMDDVQRAEARRGHDLLRVSNALLGLDHRDHHDLPLRIERPQRRYASVATLPGQIHSLEP